MELTAAEKRVEIAKDVIKQIQSSKFHAITNNYVRYDDVVGHDRADDDISSHSIYNGETKVQDIIPRIKACGVCAIGSLFLSCVDKFDKCEVKISIFPSFPQEGSFNRPSSNYSLRPYLQEYFDEDQLRLIEATYEYFNLNEDILMYEASKETDYDFFGLNDRFLFSNFETTTAQCIQFGEKYPDNKGRLIAICENIITNNGEFVL